MSRSPALLGLALSVGLALAARAGSALPIGWETSGLGQPDAAFNDGDGRAYFFFGDSFISYERKKGPERAGLRKIGSYWEGVPFSRIDAAVNMGDGFVYFFRDSKFAKVSLKTRKMVKGYPQPIESYWGRMGMSFDRVDAAMNYWTGSLYFFRGDNYIKFVIDEGVPSGYPRKIITAWKDLGFKKDIAAALRWKGETAYFFNGRKYSQYIVGQGTAKGFPRDLKRGFKGMWK